jgi:hypothetical protein
LAHSLEQFSPARDRNGSDRSLLFPAIDLPLMLEVVVKDAYDRNSSFAIHNFQRRLLEQ